MEAIIFCGIQGSGKSSYYKTHFFNSHIRISLDLLKTRNRENLFLETCIRSKMRFVVDNTNPTVADRKKYIDLTSGTGFRLVCFFFDTPVSEAIRRNELRTGRERIPIAGIKGTSAILQSPDVSEGFDTVYLIT